mmetsp:Transcript_13018/g.44133  ORF Transcript_13018/g.44133 Transcript_13018/m.44133 type:complete len:231 (-) Transcript_13018:237-929(-)
MRGRLLQHVRRQWRLGGRELRTVRRVRAGAAAQARRRGLRASRGLQPGRVLRRVHWEGRARGARVPRLRGQAQRDVRVHGQLRGRVLRLLHQGARSGPAGPHERHVPHPRPRLLHHGHDHLHVARLLSLWEMARQARRPGGSPGRPSRGEPRWGPRDRDEPCAFAGRQSIRDRHAHGRLTPRPAGVRSSRGRRWRGQQQQQRTAMCNANPLKHVGPFPGGRLSTASRGGG